MQTLRLTSSLVLAGALFTVACGDATSSLNPTAPSLVSPASLNADAGDTGGESSATGNNGNGKGNGNAGGKNNPPSNQPGDRGPGNTSPGAPGQAKVEIEGLIDSVGTDSITVNGQQVMVTNETVIRHGNRRFELSELGEGDRVHVRATRVAASASAAGGAAELEATEILLQNPARGSEEGTVAPTGAVSVEAVDGFAAERSGNGVNTGTFRLTRDGHATLLANSLTVSFTLTGTATNGSDYSSPLEVTFPAGVPTVDVVVTPTQDSSTEGTETVMLTLTTVAPYEPGSPMSASVNIADSMPVVGLNLTDSTANETNGNTGEFLLTRTGDRTQPLTVTVSYSGTATNGADYNLPTTFTFAANAAQLTVVVTAINDGLAEPSESITMTVVAGSAYELGATVQRTVNISSSTGS